MSQVIAATADEPPRRGRGRPKLDAAAVEELRGRALDAAVELLAERGAANVTIDDIAARVRVSRATLYRQVGGRDDIVLAVTLRRFDEWVDAVVAHAGRRASAGAAITEAVVFTFKSVRRDGSLGALFETGAAGTTSKVLTERATIGPVRSWRDGFAGVLTPFEGELRAGLAPKVVADRVLNVIFELLSQRSTLDDRQIRDWVAAWLLPAVLEERPPLPTSVTRTPKDKDDR